MILTYDRIAIVGYAKVGKTFVSGYIEDREIFHTDAKDGNYLGRERALITELAKHDVFAVEGVGVMRMLRDGLDVDMVLYVQAKFSAWPQHVQQRKSCDTIWQAYLKKIADMNGKAPRIMKLNEDSIVWFLSIEKRLLETE